MSQKTNLFKKSSKISTTILEEEPELEQSNHSIFDCPYSLSEEELEKIEKIHQTKSKYTIYTKHLLKYYLENLEKENNALHEAFPDVDFDIQARIKSENSYMKKAKSKENIFDIFADKIIIKSVNGKTNEDLLIAKAYEMEEFLCFYDPNIKEIPYKRKDYIKNKKTSGYSSLHITRTVNIKDEKEKDIYFDHETQIKTFRMREVEQFGSASHKKMYKDRDSLLKQISSLEAISYYVPGYLEFVTDPKTKKEHIIMQPLKERFEYYFKTNFNKFIKEKSRD